MEGFSDLSDAMKTYEQPRLSVGDDAVKYKLLQLGGKKSDIPKKVELNSLSSRVDVATYNQMNYKLAHFHVAFKNK